MRSAVGLVALIACLLGDAALVWFLTWPRIPWAACVAAVVGPLWSCIVVVNVIYPVRMRTAGLADRVSDPPTSAPTSAPALTVIPTRGTLS